MCTKKVFFLVVNIFMLLLKLYSQEINKNEEYFFFKRPSLDSLYESKKMVLAHWHSFTWNKYKTHTSTGIRESGNGYTQNRMVPGFGDNKEPDLWSPPIYFPPSGIEDVELHEAEIDIKTAMAAGIDGFLLNIYATAQAHWKRFARIVEAAEKLDTAFHIVLSPDCGTLFGDDVGLSDERVADLILRWKDHDCLMRIDGKIVVSPWDIGRRNYESWVNIIEICENRGYPIILIPGPHNVDLSSAYRSAIYEDTYAYIDFATGGQTWESSKDAFEAYETWRNDFGYDTILCLLNPSEQRPKSTTYWENANTRMIRSLWHQAIEYGKPWDWAAYMTWNDHGEDGIRPTTAYGYTYCDFGAYYSSWFKTGRQPEITKDVLFYSYRLHHTEANPTWGEKYTPKGAPARNGIELLAFLTEPGTLKIEAGGEVKTKEVEAGEQTLYMPIKSGVPKFSLVRDGETIIELNGKWIISNNIYYQNLRYQQSSSLRQLDVKKTYRFKTLFDNKNLYMQDNKISWDTLPGDNLQSACWKLEEVYYDDRTANNVIEMHYRIKNAKNGQYLYMDGDSVKSGIIPSDDERGLWLFVQEFNEDRFWIKNRRDVDHYLNIDTSTHSVQAGEIYFENDAARWILTHDSTCPTLPDFTFTKPELIFPSDTTCNAVLQDYTGTVNISHNEDSVIRVIQEPEPGTTLYSGKNEVSLFVKKNGTELTRFNMDIFVADKSSPIVSVPGEDPLIAIDSNCRGTLPDYTEWIDAYDHCAFSISYDQSPRPGTPVRGSSVPVKITVTDNSDNSTIVFLNARLADTIGPSIMSNHEDHAMALGNNPQGTIPDYTQGMLVEDNCVSAWDITLQQEPKPFTAISLNETREITLTAMDEAGNVSEVSFNLTASKKLDVRVEENDGIRIFPNPAKEIIAVKTNVPVSQILIMDTKGRVLSGINYDKSGIIDISSLPDGIHILRLISDDKIYHTKLIKQ